MKTSRYFVIGYSVFILVVLLVMYVLAGNQGVKREKQTHRGYSVEKELQPFSVVVADESFNFALESGSKHKVILRSQTDSILKVPNYKIANDTLFLQKEMMVEGVRPVFSASEYKAVVAKKSRNLFFRDIKVSDGFHLKIDRVKVWGKIDAQGNSVNIDANHSDINLNRSKINELTVRLTHTKSRFYNASINAIKGTLRDKSRIEGKPQLKLMLDMDKSSGYYLNKR